MMLIAMCIGICIANLVKNYEDSIGTGSGSANLF